MDILKEYYSIVEGLENIDEEKNNDAELYEYKDFVNAKLKKNSIKSISEMSYIQKQRFFAEAEKEWKDKKAKKAKVIDTNIKLTGDSKGKNNNPKKLKEEYGNLKGTQVKYKCDGGKYISGILGEPYIGPDEVVLYIDGNDGESKEIAITQKDLKIFNNGAEVCAGGCCIMKVNMNESETALNNINKQIEKIEILLKDE